MKYWLNGDSKNSRLPGVGAWVLSAVLPVFLAAAIAMVLMPMGNSWSRLLSLAKQVSGSGSALLSTLFSAQLGVSALVVAITQFQPGRWRATPQKLGKRWLGEMRRVSSLESRYFATSFGLIGISSIIVLGVAVCVLHNVSAGGVLLLVVAWGVHAVSSAVLNMVPATGVAVVDDYWRSLARLFYIAENWPVGLKKAKEEVKGGKLSLVSKMRRWRVVVALLSLALVLMVSAFMEKYFSGAHLGLRRQFVAGCLVVLATLLSIGAGYWHWRGGGIPASLFRLSFPLVLVQGFLMEVAAIVAATNSSFVRNLGFACAVMATIFLAVLLSMVALGTHSLWGRFACLESILGSIWVYDLKFQRRAGGNCSGDEREVIERYFVKLAKEKNKGIAKTVKKSVLLPFVTR